MKRFIKIFLITTVLLFIVLAGEVKAASASISASKTSATVGDSVSITVSIYGAAWNVGVSGAGISDKIAGYNEDAVNETKTKTYSLNTATAGTYTVQISGDVTDESDAKVYPSQSVTVTVSEPAPEPEPTQQPETTKPSNNTSSSSNNTKPSNNTTTTQTKSSNSKLATLQIAEGVISPEFSSSEKEYTICVPNEITVLSVSAIPDSSKATVSISGNEELEVGENTIEIVVKAEDGSKTIYTILATRAPEELNINALNICYINENGEKVALVTNPAFAFNVYDYTLEKLPYTVKELVVEATSNKENATIEIDGNKELKDGKNQITVRAKVLDEESGLEEIKTYTITVEREAEPIIEPVTFMQKIKNIFNGAGITKWFSDNLNKIISGMLFVATTAFVGLTIYFAYDYKKYQGLLAKLAEYNKENLMGRANVALNPEKINPQEINYEEAKKEYPLEESRTMNEEVAEEFIDPETAEICAEIEEARAKIKRGKRYKE